MAEEEAIAIREVGGEEAPRRVDELAALLVDAVEHGASVNFMAGLTEAEAEAFWTRLMPGFAAGTQVLLAAEAAGRIVGTVIVFFAPQPNAPHRAEIGKMLVHSAFRRRGLGVRLLTAAEARARAAGRSLLVLDTETGSAGDRLYRRCGWREVGTVPGFAYTTDGRLADATIFMKKI